MSYDVLTPAASVLWPYGPDFGRDYRISRAFKTDIVTSRNGTEQRRALRDRARVSLSYSAPIRDSQIAAARHWLRAHQNKPVVVADYSRSVTLAAGASAGTSAVTLSSAPSWAVEGQTIVLCGASGPERAVIASAVGASLVLTAPLSSDLAAGDRARPGYLGLLSGSVAADSLRAGAMIVNVDFSAYPGSEPPEAAGTAAASFNGYEVFPAIDPAAEIDLDFLWPIESIDYDIGRTAQFRPITTPQQLQQVDFTGLSRAQADTLEQMHLRHKGRRGAFYRPTGEKDFALAATAGSGTSSFLAAGSDLASDFGGIDFAAHDYAIAACLVDGTRYFRLITGITAEGSNSRVTINSAWPQAISSANLSRISWMPLCRFGNDELTTVWRGAQASIRMAFQTLDQLA